MLKGDAATSLPSNEDVIRGCFFVTKNGDELRENACENAGGFEKAAEWLESDMMSIGIQFNIRRVGNERS